MRTATVIPDNERWLHTPQSADDLKNALTWARATPPSDANLDATLERLADGQG